MSDLSASRASRVLYGTTQNALRAANPELLPLEENFTVNSDQLDESWEDSSETGLQGSFEGSVNGVTYNLSIYVQNEGILPATRTLISGEPVLAHIAVFATEDVTTNPDSPPEEKGSLYGLIYMGMSGNVEGVFYDFNKKSSDPLVQAQLNSMAAQLGVDLDAVMDIDIGFDFTEPEVGSLIAGLSEISATGAFKAVE